MRFPHACLIECWPDLINKGSPPQADGVLEECQLVIGVELLVRIPLLLDIFSYHIFITMLPHCACIIPVCP